MRKLKCRYDLLAGTQSNKERFNLLFSTYSFKYHKKDKTKSLSGRRNKTAVQKMLYSFMEIEYIKKIFAYYPLKDTRGVKYTYEKIKIRCKL